MPRDALLDAKSVTCDNDSCAFCLLADPGPPLYDPERRILVHYDTLGRTVVAHRYQAPGQLELLWKLRMRNSVQMMLYADTGELVLEDSPRTMSLVRKPPSTNPPAHRVARRQGVGASSLCLSTPDMWWRRRKWWLWWRWWWWCGGRGGVHITVHVLTCPTRCPQLASSRRCSGSPTRRTITRRAARW